MIPIKTGTPCFRRYNSVHGNHGFAISVRDGGVCVIKGGRVSARMSSDLCQLRLDGALAVIANNALITTIATDNVEGASAVVRVTDGTSSVLIGSAEALTVTPYNLDADDSLTTQWLTRSGVVGINVEKSSEYWFAPYFGVSLHTSTDEKHSSGGGSGGVDCNTNNKWQEDCSYCA